MGTGMPKTEYANLLYREFQRVLLLPIVSLRTEVRTDGIYIRFFPLHLSFHKIPLEDLTAYGARTYSPIREYGGWGIRYRRRSKAYNARGNRGVQLHLRNGEQILIGSQKPEEFVKAIDIALAPHASLRYSTRMRLVSQRFLM